MLTDIDKEFFERFEGIADIFTSAQTMDVADGPDAFEDKSYLACFAVTKMLGFASWKIRQLAERNEELKEELATLRAYFIENRLTEE